MSKPEVIKIDEVEYVRKGAALAPAISFEGMPYVICRTYSAGVFAGYVASRKEGEVTMQQARRIWHWKGAASLSQLAVDGTSQPNQCKFPCAVDKIVLLNVIEILSCTEKAQKSIQAVRVWEV